MDKNEAAATLGRIGGRKKSEAKTLANRKKASEYWATHKTLSGHSKTIQDKKVKIELANMAKEIAKAQEEPVIPPEMPLTYL